MPNINNIKRNHKNEATKLVKLAQHYIMTELVKGLSKISIRISTWFELSKTSVTKSINVSKLVLIEYIQF